MSEITIFDYSDYRLYIENKLKGDGFGRGGKARLAQHLCCQPSFVSQVLKDKSSFSLEQAFKLNVFLKHNSLEKEYFMVLVEFDRSGTQDLKNFFESKRLELVEKSKLIENQMSYDQLSDADVITYYNDWNNTLMRNLIEIPDYKTVESLRKRMNLSQEKFDECFSFLTEKGLIKVSDDGTLEQGHTWLHVKKGSPLAKYGYITTRLQMIKNYESVDEKSLNYTSYMTLPKKSLEDFRKKFKALILELNEHLDEEAHAETMAVLTVDFMET